MSEPARVPIGPTAFVQACARMMSAAWIRRQIDETSTGPPFTISGVAYALRFTVASDIGMAFELALKSLVQGLSLNEDGQPQVLKGHHLMSYMWEDIDCSIRNEVDENAELAFCRSHGSDKAGKILPFSKYVEKHTAFLNQTVDNRYAIGADDQWEPDHRFLQPIARFHVETYDGRFYFDGLDVLLAYWWAIMNKALELRWPEVICVKDKDVASDRDEARALTKRAIRQMFGDLKVLTNDEVLDKRFEKLDPSTKHKIEHELKRTFTKSRPPCLHDGAALLRQVTSGVGDNGHIVFDVRQGELGQRFIDAILTRPPLNPERKPCGFAARSSG